MAVFSVSTMMESKSYPRAVPTASSYFFCLGLQSSPTFPRTPGYRRFRLAMVSFLLVSLSLCAMPARAVSRLVRVTRIFSSSSVRMLFDRMRSDLTRLYSFFLASTSLVACLTTSLHASFRLVMVLSSAWSLVSRAW